MLITNLISIKNYNAGKGGNMLVSLDEKLTDTEIYLSPKGEERRVPLLICTAYVVEDEAISLLEQKCDTLTPCNKVIVVSKQFLKMGSKKQLALLEIQNAMQELQDPSNNCSRRIYGEIAAIERYGHWTFYWATKKEAKIQRRGVKKASRGLHRAYKKETKELKKIENLVEDIADEVDAASC